jgi:hypothetical protein
VEGALLLHPAVAGGIIGLPDVERGMIVKAFVVLKPGTRRRHHHDATGPRQIDPGALQVPQDRLHGLPRTETGNNALNCDHHEIHQNGAFSPLRPAGIVLPALFYLLHEVQEDFLAHIGTSHELIRSGIGVHRGPQNRVLGMCRNGVTAVAGTDENWQCQPGHAV